MRNFSAWAAAALAGGMIAIAGCGSDDGGGDKPAEPVKLDTKQVFERGKPGTVSITGLQGDQPSGGTGIIFDTAEGLVLTNHHVVAGLAQLKAKVLDEQEIPIQVVGTAPCEDLAVVKLTSKPAGMKALTFGDSARVENQDEVTVLGYPSSFEDPTKQKVVSTSGNVQSPEVEADIGPSAPKLSSTIQHSATVNHGNSGGPLLNDRAEVIGVNTLINTGEAGEVENQFYSITSNRVKEVLPDLKAGKNIADAGWNLQAFSETPISSLYELTGYGTAAEGERLDQQLQAAGIDGMVVLAVSTPSPAEDAQITGGDMITAINGAPVTSYAQVCDALRSATPGQVMNVEGVYITSGGEEAAPGDPWKVRMTLPKQ